MPASFVAASSQYINLGINQNYCVNCSGHTVAAWIYVTDTTIGRSVISVSVGAVSSTITSRASIVVLAGGTLSLISRASDFDLEHDCNTAAGAIAVNTWYHVVGVTNLVAATQTVYINGVQIAQLTAVAFNQTTTSNTSAYNSCIGAEDNGSSGYMSGYIHDARIYSRALGGDEIMTMYTSGGKDGIIYGQDGRFLLSEGAPGTSISSVQNLGTVKTAGTPSGGPTYAIGILEVQ